MKKSNTLRPARQSVAIVGEGSTEYFYFEALRALLRLNFKFRPELPNHSDLDTMLSKAEMCTRNYDWVYLIVDMDRMLNDPKEMKKYQAARKEKRYRQICFIENNPCIELWFVLHFWKKESIAAINSDAKACDELRKFVKDYEKRKGYFEKQPLTKRFNDLHGLEQAKSNGAKFLTNKELKTLPYTELHLLIEELTRE